MCIGEKYTLIDENRDDSLLFLLHPDTLLLLNMFVQLGLNRSVHPDMLQKLFLLRHPLFFLLLWRLAFRPCRVLESDAVVSGEHLLSEDHSVGVAFDPWTLWHVVDVARVDAPHDLLGDLGVVEMGEAVVVHAEGGLCFLCEGESTSLTRPTLMSHRRILQLKGLLLLNSHSIESGSSFSTILTSLSTCRLFLSSPTISTNSSFNILTLSLIFPWANSHTMMLKYVSSILRSRHSPFSSVLIAIDDFYESDW